MIIRNHNWKKMYRKHIAWVSATWLFLLLSPALQGQVEEDVYKRDYRLDSTAVKSLYIELDNISFFKDNEFGGVVMKGYSLPGLWLQPKAVYRPLPNIKLELGVHALIYSGAYKYPNFAYRDIATWKGSQFQKGAHLLPFFRAQFALRKVNLVIGNLYGGSTHDFITPLYYPELSLTADPEMGFQLLYDTRAFHLDAWINWQSYIFNLDSHQEAFTVGLSARIEYNRPDSRLHFYSPLQALAHHRGGEQDTLTTNTMQTLENAAAGIGMTWNTGGRIVQRVNAEADALFYYQQAGNLYPLDNGIAFYAAVQADLKDFYAKGGYFYGKDFVTLYGVPYFGSLSTQYQGSVFHHPQTLFLTAGWTRNWGKHYAVGAEVELYQSFPGTVQAPDGTRTSPGSTTNFSFGIFFKVNPSFLVKKWK